MRFHVARNRCSLLVASAILLVTSCGASPKKTPSVAPAASPRIVAASASASASPPEGDPEKAYPQCAAKRCTIRRVTDDVKKRLEAIVDHESLTITFEPFEHDFEGSFPTIVNLHWLQSLEISYATLTSLAPLAKLPKLTKLVMHDVVVPSLVSLGGAHALRELELERLGIDKSIAALTSLTELRTLRLKHLALKDISPARSLVNLRHFELDGMTLRDWAPIGALGALESLKIVRSSIEALPDLSGLTSTIELHLEGNQSLVDFTKLSSLPGARRLHLVENRLMSLAPLAKMTSLEDLSIEFSSVKDLKPLAGLQALKTLLVNQDCPLSERSKLQKAVPGVVITEWTPKGGAFIEHSSPTECVLIVQDVSFKESIACPATK